MKCENCGEKHNGEYGSGRFCSSKCARGFSTKAKRKEINEKVSNSLKGKKFTEEHKKALKKSPESILKQSESLKKYWKGKIENIKNTLPFEQWPESLRRRTLFEEVNYKCEECGYNYIDENEKGPYQIHHIDGNNKNNKRENLKILCMNCHWKTDNWGFKNRKHSKESIKKRTATRYGPLM